MKLALKIILSYFAVTMMLMMMGFSADWGSRSEIYIRNFFIFLLLCFILFLIWRDEVDGLIVDGISGKKVLKAVKIGASVVSVFVYMLIPGFWISTPILAGILFLLWKKQLRSLINQVGYKGLIKIKYSWPVVLVIVMKFCQGGGYITHETPVPTDNELQWTATAAGKALLRTAEGDSIRIHYSGLLQPDKGPILTSDDRELIHYLGYEFGIHLSQPDTVVGGYFAIIYREDRHTDSCYLRATPKWIDDLDDYNGIPIALATQKYTTPSDTFENCIISRFDSDSFIRSIVLDRDSGIVAISLRSGEEYIRIP